MQTTNKYATALLGRIEATPIQPETGCVSRPANRLRAPFAAPDVIGTGSDTRDRIVHQGNLLGDAPGRGTQCSFAFFHRVAGSGRRESRDCSGPVRALERPISGDDSPRSGHRGFNLPVPPPASTPVLLLHYSRPTKQLQKDRQPPFAPRASLRTCLRLRECLRR